MGIPVNILVDHFWHITNQHKKCDVCQNIFQSKKVLEAHKRSVHNKVQLKLTIKNHKNKK